MVRFNFNLSGWFRFNYIGLKYYTVVLIVITTVLLFIFVVVNVPLEIKYWEQFVPE